MSSVQVSKVRWAAVLAGAALVVSLFPASSASGLQQSPPEQPPTFGPRDGAEQPPSVPGELLVRFAPATTAADRDRVRAQHGLEHVETLPLDGLELMRVAGEGSASERAAQVQRDRSVRYAEPNHIVRPASIGPVIPDDPEFASLWGLRNTGQTGGTAGVDISASQAWTVTSGSDQVVVGVIDSGTWVDHPDLAENIWLNVGELPVPQDPAGNDLPGHDANGDGVVSIRDYDLDPRMMACTGGAPPVPSDLFCLVDGIAGYGGTDTDGNGFVDDIFGWDFFNDDNTVFDPLDGDGHGTHVAGTIAAVTDNGVGVAGVSDARIMLRTDYVADVDSNLRLEPVAGAPYQGLPEIELQVGGSGAGQSWSDAVSPRSGALAGLQGRDTTWYDGTSMASPHVAGAAAQLLAAYPGTGHLQLKDRLMDTGDPVAALAGTTVSGKRLNLAQALDTPGPPQLYGVSAAPQAFNPRRGETTTLTWTQTEPGRVTVAVGPLGGPPVRTEVCRATSTGTAQQSRRSGTRGPVRGSSRAPGSRCSTGCLVMCRWSCPTRSTAPCPLRDRPGCGPTFG